MWLFITLRSVFASVMPLTQPGSWECQTRVWPRTRCPREVARLTIWSAGPKVNEPRDRSVASHFISFSGVTELNSRSRIVEYVPSPSFPAATAVPKYRPDWAAWAPRVEALTSGESGDSGAAVAVPGTTMTAAASSPNAEARRRLSRLRRFTVLLSTVVGCGCGCGAEAMGARQGTDSSKRSTRTEPPSA